MIFKHNQLLMPLVVSYVQEYLAPRQLLDKCTIAASYIAEDNLLVTVAFDQDTYISPVEIGFATFIGLDANRIKELAAPMVEKRLMEALISGERERLRNKGSQTH